jgi:hypothetical protein
MTMMPRESRGQNDAAVKSHRRCSERHKEDAKAACPRLLCANTKYTIASLVSNDEKAKVVVLLRALLVMMLCCLEQTQQTSKCPKKTKKKRERERRKTLSHTTKVKKFVCLTVLCPHEKCTDRSHVWFKTTLCNMTLLFFVRFFLSLSLSLDTPKKKKHNF